MFTKRFLGPSVLTLAIVPALIALNGCQAPDSHAEELRRIAEHRPVHVDSVFSVEEEIRRFRADLPEHAPELSGGEAGIDALIGRFVSALGAGDTAVLREMALSRAEFADLYYPTSQYTRPPYELGPSLVWFRMESRGSRGLNRALQRFAGKPLELQGYRCNPDPAIEGENRIWTGCVLDLGDGTDDPLPVALFGAVVERDGHFKFTSYVNSL